MEIIPAVDIRKGRCVRLRQGLPQEEIIYSRDPLAMARRWEREGAKRLHVVDLDAAFCGRPMNKKLIATLARKLSIPIQVGGGIRTLEHIGYYLSHGVDKIILATKVLQDRRFLVEVNKRFPRRILIALDACPVRSKTSNGVKDYKLAFRGWKKISSVTALSLARELDSMGAAGIIYTDISRDGMLKGPNVKFMRTLLKEITSPIYISGGISRVSDIKKIKTFSRNQVKGVIIGQALYSGRIKLKDAIKSS